MINNYEEDSKEPALKYYTNIVTGQYFTFDQNDPNKVVLFTPKTQNQSSYQSPDMDPRTKAIIHRIISYEIAKRRAKSHRYDEAYPWMTKEEKIFSSFSMDHYNPIYEEYFVKQIISYQQFLMSFRSKVSIMIKSTIHALLTITCFIYCTNKANIKLNGAMINILHSQIISVHIISYITDATKNNDIPKNSSYV